MADHAAPLTPEEARRLSGFTEYRKTAMTPISDRTFPAGTVYQTPEGLRAEDEETRAAFDVQGGIYPIRESVFLASYESAERATRAGDEGLRAATQVVVDDLARVFQRDDDADPVNIYRMWVELHDHAAALRAALAAPAPAPALTLTPELFDALGEVLAAHVYPQNDPHDGSERYVCRMCDRDVTTDRTHEPDCEYQMLRAWSLAAPAPAPAAEDRLDFWSFDGSKEVRLAQGDNCVAVTLVGSGGVVLTADEAEAMGHSLLRRAAYSREAIRG